MTADDYFVAGTAIALSLVNEGTAPHFLAPELFETLVSGPDSVKVSVHALPDSHIKEDFLAVSFGLTFATCIFRYKVWLSDVSLKL